ncbi:uncharacterized protein LOC135836921 [Planococcus citri]|uniref:uncharacterized protein LOC135836921 n=1 Tax=Planococcus citri TaxID=170843 RepID=UPI0031F9C957
MNFNFGIKSKVTLLPVFVAFYSTIQLIEAGLPNEDLWKTVPCIRKFFGDEFVQELYRNELNPLTNGEYLAAFCNDFAPEKIDETVKEKAGGNYEGGAIEECLQNEYSAHLFHDYAEMGKGFAQLEAEKLVGEGQSVKSKLFSKAKSAHLDSESADTPIHYFLDGVCHSEKKVVSFDSLTDANDKAVILECFTQCTGNLIQRIRTLLTAGKEEAVQVIEVNKKEISKPSSTIPIEEELKLKDECETRKKNLEEVAKLSEEYTKEKFDSDRRIPSVSKSTTITHVGKEYLIKLGGLYDSLTEYLTAEVEKEDSILGNLDNKLGGVFYVYQNYCSEQGCGVTRDSVPLYDDIQSDARDNESTIVNTVNTWKGKVYEWIRLRPRNWKRFCKALIRPLSTDSKTNIKTN